MRSSTVVRDIWRLSGIAVLFIVLLRLSIGWQFAYEGLWKLNTLSSPKPWTSAGYLRAARGPFRNLYRGMAGDPDDLHYLDYDEVSRCLDDFKARFVAFHPDLSDEQKEKLDEILDGPEEFSVHLAKLPPGITIDKKLAKTIRYDPQSKRLIVDGKKHLLPKEHADLLKQAVALKNYDTDPVIKRYINALNQVFKQASKLSYKERLAVLLRIDPERVGLVYRDENTKEVVEQRKGKITQYNELLSRYLQELPRARQAFEIKHLDVQWDEIQKLRAELVNPVRSLENDFKQEATKLLDVKQLARGPVQEPWTAQRRIDYMTIAALIGLGCLLMIGLFSRVAAVGAALLLLSFYLAAPPWPGVEELVENAGPEHSLFANKNLIEVIALLGIASMPTGQWFGLDRLFVGLFSRRRLAKSPAPSLRPLSTTSPAGPMLQTVGAGGLGARRPEVEPTRNRSQESTEKSTS
jgi:uncharacterized membrane protein YphA (DoxX/SURF4 family)